MRRLFSRQLISLLLVATAAGASDSPSQSPGNPATDSTAPPDTSAATTQPATSTPSVTVTGKVSPPPKLAPDKFTACYAANNINGKASDSPIGEEGINWTDMAICQAELARDTRIVIDKCTNRDGKSAPPVAIQACTELLDRKLLEGRDRFYPSRHGLLC
jgi:hypothetical protein